MGGMGGMSSMVLLQLGVLVALVWVLLGCCGWWYGLWVCSAGVRGQLAPLVCIAKVG